MKLPEFRNETFTNFGDEKNSVKMREALEEVRKELGREYDLIIGGKRVKASEKFTSYNPAKKNEVVGIFEKATVDLADEALLRAEETFLSWNTTPPEIRAKVAVDVASIMRDRRFYYAAWMTYEVGKSWIEADADVAEAIDFCEFYARECLRLGNYQSLSPIAGEKNHLRYIPLGVGVVIPPWNFPLAILVGMTVASLVTGNTVVLKPSSDSPTVGYKFMEALEAAGMPAGVVNYLPGPGASVGNALVAHPRTRFITFTGSKEVGLGINELAAKTQPGQIWIKRVVAEMGGKDSIVVDEDSDLEQAINDVTNSAFGYSGQKCSACSRAIVVESVYDQFVEKIKEQVEQIKIGQPDDPKNYTGPVINENAKKSIMNYIQIGKTEGRLITGGEEGSQEGHFIQPTVIADIPPEARISQEEIFGPVLAIIKASSYADALEIANNTEYGLTGSVYTGTQEKIDQAAKIFHVGNLYMNRKCTGAFVGAHPFGGFNMSGTDSKAGGKDYLLLFTQAKTISQKITS